MKKFLKFLIISLACLFLIICVAGYVILKHVDLNPYKGIIEKKVQEATGRELKMGNIQVKPSFSPIIEVQDVSFANATWAKSPEMVKIGAIDVSVSLLPLLHNSYVINRFVIKNAEVNLEENKDGVFNWVFEVVEEEKLPEEKTSYHFSLIKEARAEEVQDDSLDKLLSSIVIKEVALENVKINYTDKKANTQSYDIKTFTLDENDDDNIDFNFNVNDGLYQGQGTVGALKLLKSQKGYPIKADVKVMGIGIVADALLFDVLGDIRFDGNVKAKGFLGKDSSYNESADISAKGDLKVIDAVVNSVSIAGNVITGTVKAKLDEKVPVVVAKLSSDKIDLASFKSKSKIALDLSLLKEARATTMVPATAIPYEALYSVKADAQLNIAKIMNNAAAVAEGLVLNAMVDSGKANVAITQGKLANGDIKLNAVLNASQKTFALNADAIKINLSDLLSALDAQSESFKFTNGSNTDLYLKLNGQGSTYAAIAESLNGQIVAIVDKSDLHLGNIGMMKGNIFSQLLNTLNITKGNDNLALNCAVVRTDIKNGLAKFPNGVVVNADKFTIIADGDINLKNDKLGFSVKPFGGKLTDTNIAKALSSLVRLTGTLQDPAVGVDTANVVKNVVGATMTGPVYLGAQMVMENDNSPCYTALKDTGYEARFPKSQNMAKSTKDDMGKVLDNSVDMVKDTAKGLFNMFSKKKADEQ